MCLDPKPQNCVPKTGKIWKTPREENAAKEKSSLLIVKTKPREKEETSPLFPKTDAPSRRSRLSTNSLDVHESNDALGRSLFSQSCRRAFFRLRITIAMWLQYDGALIFGRQFPSLRAPSFYDRPTNDPTTSGLSCLDDVAIVINYSASRTSTETRKKKPYIGRRAPPGGEQRRSLTKLEGVIQAVDTSRRRYLLGPQSSGPQCRALQAVTASYVPR